MLPVTRGGRLPRSGARRTISSPACCLGPAAPYTRDCCRRRAQTADIGSVAVLGRLPGLAHSRLGHGPGWLELADGHPHPGAGGHGVQYPCNKHRYEGVSSGHHRSAGNGPRAGLSRETAGQDVGLSDLGPVPGENVYLVALTCDSIGYGRPCVQYPCHNIRSTRWIGESRTACEASRRK
jgi:hypothetical protein